ncbi:hypothetical protein Tco_0810890 [Tanacetum coccineum]
MSIQDMEVRKQQYLEEMRSMINQIQIEDYHNMRIDIHYIRECEISIDMLKDNFNKMSIEIEKITKEKELRQREQAANLSTYTVEPSRRDENLSTIPEKESDEFIKSSVEDLGEILVTFSNPLFNDNDAFTSSDDESLPEEDVPKENFKIYSNPLFEFDDEYISSDVNPLFNEVLEDIESEDSYVSKLNEPDLLVTPLSKLNEDECFDPGGDFVLEEIKACLTSDSIPPGYDDDDFNPEGDIFLLEKLLNDDPSSPLPPKELNFEELKDTIPNLLPEVFLDHDPRSLEDEPDKDDLKNIVKVFNPGIQMKIISLTNVRFTFKDRHYFSLTFVIKIFLLYLTYSMDSSFLFSSGSKDTIFDPGISAFSFYSLEPVDCPDYEDSRARGFVHRSLEFQSFACLYMESDILDLID